MFGLIVRGVLLGIGATVLFDLWQWLVAWMLRQPAPNLAPMGRWFWYLLRGRMFHADIGKAEPYVHERALGWFGHYVVGAIYGVVFALLAGPGWFAAPRILPAWLFGVATSRQANGAPGTTAP